jgi:preprotein translocase subunit SecF
LQFLTDTNVDFMRRRHIAFAISGFLIVAGLVSLGLRRGPNFGVDFRGGVFIQAKFEEPITTNEIRSALQAAGIAQLRVQRGETNDEVVISTSEVETEALMAGKLLFSVEPSYQTDLANLNIPEGLRQEFESNEIVLSENATVSIEEEDNEWLIADSGGKYYVRKGEDKLNIYAGESDVSELIKGVLTREGNSWKVDEKGINIDKVSASVGRDLMSSAIKSGIIALVLILAYIWFRFELRFGVAAIITLVHDVIVTLGIFSILNEEINLPTIAAFLTIIGYSLNDTIVVFDRIRENIKVLRGKEFDELINTSINQTISRTIITSMTTLFAVISIFALAKVGTLHTLSLALLIGVIVGTYSSIFVASPILHGWHLRLQREK